MTHERLERRMEAAEAREERRTKHDKRSHPARPIASPIGALICAICGGAVRQWPDGRFPLHATVEA